MLQHLTVICEIFFRLLFGVLPNNLFKYVHKRCAVLTVSLKDQFLFLFNCRHTSSKLRYKRLNVQYFNHRSYPKLAYGSIYECPLIEIEILYHTMANMQVGFTICVLLNITLAFGYENSEKISWKYHPPLVNKPALDGKIR